MTLPQASHPVEEVCHCLFIFLKGGEAIREASGDLTIALGCLRQVTTLGEDLLSVGVGNVGFDHAGMMAWIRGQWGKWCAPARLSQPLSSDTNPYRQKYNTTNSDRQPTQSIKQWRTYSLHIRALQYFSQTHEEFAILYNEPVSIMMCH